MTRFASVLELDRLDEPPPVRGPEDFYWNEAQVETLPQDETASSLKLITPADWTGTDPEPMKWLATNRIPAGDTTILSSDGGGGKTTISLQLAVSVAAGLGDWLGTTTEIGPVLFVSAEEDEAEIRRRVVSICRNRGLDPDVITNLYFHFPDLERSLFASATKSGMVWTPLWQSFKAEVEKLKPSLVVVDAVAAIFGGDHRDRAQVRAFMSPFRKLAIETGAAIVALDHPSLSGMQDNSGRAGSVDWSNVVRSRLYMRKHDDGDLRELEVKKANRGPVGEKVQLRWSDGSFVLAGGSTPYERMAAEAQIDAMFIKLLEKRNAQGRHVGPKPGRNFAASEFEKDVEAKEVGVKSAAFVASMERLYAAGKIVSVEHGPPSRSVTRIERATE